jgi:hypothetical protein
VTFFLIITTILICIERRAYIYIAGIAGYHLQKLPDTIDDAIISIERIVVRGGRSFWLIVITQDELIKMHTL